MRKNPSFCDCTVLYWFSMCKSWKGQTVFAQSHRRRKPKNDKQADWLRSVKSGQQPICKENFLTGNVHTWTQPDLSLLETLLPLEYWSFLYSGRSRIVAFRWADVITCQLTPGFLMRASQSWINWNFNEETPLEQSCCFRAAEWWAKYCQLKVEYWTEYWQLTGKYLI